MINVSKTYLPPQDRYLAIMNRAWQKGWITNNGELVQELEASLCQTLQVPYLLYSSNGTVVLQMALKSLGSGGGDIITTPYSYVATAHSIQWEGFRPVFADIDPVTFCIDPAMVEAAITPRTRAILATHVYGMPCNTDALAAIGQQYGLPVIYDGAHAFGTRWQGQSLLAYGDMSTCSFHATKIFHTVEGGCIICRQPGQHALLEGYRQFGHKGDDHYSIGVNGKNSELHAAMGLAILPDMPALIAERRHLFAWYKQALDGLPLQLLQPAATAGLEWNYAYFPALFPTEQAMLQVKAALEAIDIFPRRYFFPALHSLPFYGSTSSCPVAASVAARMLCLPFYNGLEPAVVERIAAIIRDCL
ncbi:MAG: DegT/DnrJ/EryC1/StrS family aminotransferase [Chitinophagaceae bacterium]|nr:DegT/DnrJ/EryC1/StrS family aminotransferase [Chitinophagaceae bacterium]